MNSKAPFLHTVASNFPESLSTELNNLLSSASTEVLLDNLIRFVCGADCSNSLSGDLERQWVDRQSIVRQKLSGLLSNTNKRSREDDCMDSEPSQSSKRQKTTTSTDTPLDKEDTPLFTLHSISVTSPVRKKVDITISKSSIRFSHPTTHTLEAVVPLSRLRRGFLLPTRGKLKPHWTIVLISNDIPDQGKAAAPASQSTNNQMIFGLDAAAPSAISATDYTSSSDDNTISLKKGEETLPILRRFLSFLSFPILEPHVDIFKSACGGNTNGGVPGIEAYRGAKPGSLWFMKEGILWGESKPCEFWAVGDLINKSEGLRIISATGRVCTLILTRRVVGNAEEDEDEDVGEETAFGQIDGKEQDSVNQWVKKYRHLFGKKDEGESTNNERMKRSESPELPKPKPVGPITINQIGDEDDEEDEDFNAEAESGSDSSSSSSEEEGDEDGNGNGNGDDDEDDAEGSDDDGEAEDENVELKEEHHPLLRPGAMPRMSRAAIDMVVGMVEDDLVGVSSGAGNDEEEEDELED